MSTLFVDTQDMARLVRQHGLFQLFQDLADKIQNDYARWDEFDKCPRVANHIDIGVVELMPTSDQQFYAYKYVNGHPQNTRINLSTVMAYGGLSDMQTGFPLLVSELTLATAIRTAATSVMAARLFARKDAKTMAVIGNGAQSEFQILAFYHVLGITHIRLFDVDAEATDKLVAHLSAYPEIQVTRCVDTAQAVEGADIITTITADKAYATIITADMVKPGVYLNAVGGDCPGKTELDADVLQKATVFVEFEEQSRIEGDVQQMPADFPVTEIWRVIQGLALARKSDDEIIVFDSVGFAMEDFSTLCLIHDLAQRYKLGRMIKLIPDLDNPKDLFGLLQEVADGDALKHSA